MTFLLSKQNNFGRAGERQAAVGGTPGPGSRKNSVLLLSYAGRLKDVLTNRDNFCIFHRQHHWLAVFQPNSGVTPLGADVVPAVAELLPHGRGQARFELDT